MKYSIVLAVLFFAAANAATSSNSTGKVVNGYYASPGQFPYVVSLKTSDLRLYCAGSLISSRWVLTTASCYDTALYYVGVGNNYLQSQTHYIIYLFATHAYYDKYTGLYDIMMIKTLSSIPYSSSVYPIQISYYPTNDNYQYNGMSLSGWGQTTAGFRNPYTTTNYLMYVFYNTLPPSSCAYYNGAGGTGLPYSSSIQICAVGQYTYQGSSGACFGDAGSPLVYNNIQYGITSRGTYSVSGYPVCAVGYPDVFTRVSVFSNWVTTIMAVF